MSSKTKKFSLMNAKCSLLESSKYHLMDRRYGTTTRATVRTNRLSFGPPFNLLVVLAINRSYDIGMMCTIKWTIRVKLFPLACIYSSRVVGASTGKHQPVTSRRRSKHYQQSHQRPRTYKKLFHNRVFLHSPSNIHANI